MAALNKCFLLGNITRDPEVKFTPKGTAVCSIGVAINRTWRDEQGEDKNETTFLEVETWGKQAENCGKYLSKGKPVLVEGRLKLDQWDDKTTGQKKQRLKVVAEKVQFLSAGKAEASAEEPAPKPSAAAATGEGKDDNVPF